MILMSCNDSVSGSVVFVFRNLLNLIWIIGPILAIISLIINISLMVKNPDDNKIVSKIKNSIIALFVLFFIPMFVNITINLAGGDFSECWNQTDSRFNSSPSYMDPYSGKKKQSIINDPSDYEDGKKREVSDGGYSGDYGGVTVTSCGSLEYCNKFLTSLYVNSKRLNDAILQNNASVVYSNSGDPQSWEEAINVAKAGKTVKISCNRPSHWGMRDITGEYRDFWSLGAGGFNNYAGPMTNYTRQLKFDGSKSVKSAIQEGIVQPGDIIGTSGHTFAIYSVDRKSGSAVVVDGGHQFTNKCQQRRECSTMFTYSAGTNAGFRLYQIIRWVK